MHMSLGADKPAVWSMSLSRHRSALDECRAFVVFNGRLTPFASVDPAKRIENALWNLSSCPPVSVAAQNLMMHALFNRLTRIHDLLMFYRCRDRCRSLLSNRGSSCNCIRGYGGISCDLVSAIHTHEAAVYERKLELIVVMLYACVVYVCRPVFAPCRSIQTDWRA